MTIKNKILLWFLVPSVMIAFFFATFCYIYTQKTIRKNIFDQLEIAADNLQEQIISFLKEKKDRVNDYTFDDLIRTCTEEITDKEGRKKHYTTILNDHLITNKKSLSPNINEVFLVDFKGKVIASTDEVRIGKYVLNEEYFTEVEFLNAYASAPHYDPLSEELVVYFSTVLLSKIIRDPIGLIVNRIKVVEKDEYGGLSGAAASVDYGESYSQLVTSNKTRIIDFSSDGFIRDCAESIIHHLDNEHYYRDRLNNYLDLEIRSTDDSILAIYIVDLTGKVISSTEIGIIGKDVSNEAYFMETMKYGFAVTDLHPSPVDRHGSFEFAKLLFSKDGLNMTGIIVARYSGESIGEITYSGLPEEFKERKQSKGLGETGKLLIVNRDKLMITKSRFTEDAVLKQVVDTEGVAAAFDNGVGIVGIYHDYRGAPVLGVSRYIEDMDWVILAEKDSSEAFAPIKHLRNFTIIVGTVGIIVIVVIAFLLAMGITKHIKRLKMATEKIVEGDLEHPVIVDKMESELKDLGGSFNLMLKKLKESRERNIHLFMDVKKSRDEWQNTFDAIADIITIHSRDFRIIRANKAFFEKFEIARMHLSDKKCYEIFYGNDAHCGECLLVKCALSKKPEVSEVNNFTIDGSFLTYAYPMMDEKGEIYRFVHLARDITYQKNLQRQFVDKADKLIKAHKELEQLSHIVTELSEE